MHYICSFVCLIGQDVAVRAHDGCYPSFSFPTANVGCSRTPPVFSSYSTILSSSCPGKKQQKNPPQQFIYIFIYLSIYKFQRNSIQASPQKSIVSHPHLPDPVAILVDAERLLQVQAVDVARDALQHPFIRPAGRIRGVFKLVFDP